MKKIIVIWVICGIIAWGATLGTVTERWGYPSRDHYGFALFISCMGPFGLVLSVFLSNIFQHDFKWK